MGGSHSSEEKGASAGIHTLGTRVDEPRFLLVTDLDHTLVEHDEPSHGALQEFNEVWLRKLAMDSLLIYSTGRSPTLFNELYNETPLLLPDVLVCSVGTEILHNTGKGYVADAQWEAKLDEGWDASVAAEIGEEFDNLELQQESEQRPHKVSFNISVSGDEAEEVVSGLRENIRKKRLDARVVYSGGADIDILPSSAGKGNALQYLLEKLEEAGKYPTDGIQVNGDSGNDIDLFQVRGVTGCIVANAHAELLRWAEANEDLSIFKASKNCARGILEALSSFYRIPEKDNEHSKIADFIMQSYSSQQSLESSIADGYMAIGSDGKKLHGKEAVSAVWASDASVRWLDEIEIFERDELILVIYKYWRLTPEGRKGSIVSGLIGKKDDKLGWQFMHCTAI